MAFNWITVCLIAILVWSMIQGLRRGFAYQAGNLTAQVISLAAGLIAVIIAWKGSTQLAYAVQTAHAKLMPQWLQWLFHAWQQAPQIAQMIAFGFVFLVSTNVIHSVLRGIPVLVAKGIPRRIAASQLLGGLLGTAEGGIKALLLGAVLFVGLHYFSIPSLASQAGKSAPFRYLSSTVYKPWLQPVVARELPVLSRGALQPLASNINLFVLPTLGSEQKRGLLVVPKPIAALAKSITSDSKTPRDKAHALYEWEIHHIHYDWRKYDDFVYHKHWDGQSPMQTLKTHKGVCADYALLYADMAHSVGIGVQIDEGIGGSGQQYGPHAWNQVYDPEARDWLPVDTTWGAEQDTWFDPPQFQQTHREQISILVQGGAI